MERSFAELVAEAAYALDDASVEAIAARIERVGDAGPAARAAALGDLTPSAARVAGRRLVEEWNRGFAAVPAAAVVAAIRAAGALARRHRAATSSELVWTGPAPAGSELRRIDQALLELVGGARRSILVVSFAVTYVPAIVLALEKAANRGVQLRMIFETEEHAGDRFDGNPMDNMPIGLRRAARTFVWPRERRERQLLPGGREAVGVLHAKCALVDDEALLVSSANLTGFALTLNMELGVIVRGGELPKRVRRHFDGLFAAHVFEDAP